MSSIFIRFTFLRFILEYINNVQCMIRAAIIIVLSCSCTVLREVVVGVGDEEAITCTDIGELL